MKEKLTSRLPWVAFTFIVLFAGLNPIAVRYTVLELPPFWGGAIRFFPASLIMFLLAFFLKIRLPKGRALVGAFIYGVVQFGIGFAMLNWGLQKVQPGMASIILSLAPLFTMIFAIIHRLERFRWLALIGSLISVTGVGLVFQEQIGTKVPFLSLLAVILGGMCLSETTVLIKILPKNNPITTNAIGMGTGATLLLLLAFVSGERIAIPVRSATWGALIYSILIGSCVVFMLIFYALKHMSASTLSFQFVLFPFVTLSISNLLTHEALNPGLLAGAAIVIIGVFIGGIYSPRKRVAMQPAKIIPILPDPPVINPAADCLQTGDC